MRPMVPNTAVLLAAVLLLAGSAQAQRAAPEAAAPGPLSYEELVQRGEAAVIGADWNACVEYFTKAHEMRPSEVTFLAIGRCALERGDYVDALSYLQQGMRYSLTERQRASVENLKARALQHLGRYRVQLQPADATLLIAGEQPQPDSEGYIWLQVGRYPVSVTAPGYEPMEGELAVQAGDEGLISYSLPASAPQGPADPSRSSGVVAGDESSFPVAPVVVASIGGALLIGAVVTGVLALGEKNDLEDRCTLGPNGNLCDPSLMDTRDRAETLALVTDVLWISGTVAVGTGLLLYLLQSDDGEENVGVNAAAGPSGGSLTVTGRF